VPRLVHLNGPPGIGKTTIARRYVDDHALAFCMDIDGIRCLIGCWEEHAAESGRLARRMAVEMARTHLSGGHDVVVPQFAVAPAFIRQLAEVAAECGASFHEVVLWAETDAAQARFDGRADDPGLAAHHRDASRMIRRSGGFLAAHGELRDVLDELPGAVLVPTESGGVDGAYRSVLSVLGIETSEGTAP
jgi:predicted kinase